jgi:hypothetical protein
MSNIPMSEQLKSLLPSNSKKKAVILTAALHESAGWVEDSWVMFSAPANERIYISSTQSLFGLMRDAVREASGDHNWSVRQASQVKSENVPFLHNSTNNVILFDPFALFRDPLRELYANRYLLWPIFPSQPYYFKPYAEADALKKRLAHEQQIKNSLMKSQPRVPGTSSSADSEVGRTSGSDHE